MIIMILVLSLAAVALLLSLPMADSDTVDDESITFSYETIAHIYQIDCHLVSFGRCVRRPSTARRS